MRMVTCTIVELKISFKTLENLSLFRTANNAGRFGKFGRKIDAFDVSFTYRQVSAQKKNVNASKLGIPRDLWR